jgi:hypothetical protein
MKANELRIGNYVCRKPHKVWIPFTVKDGEINEKFASTCNPIPITEEWLLKLGFTKKDDDYIIEYGRQGFIVALAQDTDWIISYRDDIGCNYNALIFLDYVHHLQNIILDLTEEI